MQDRLKTLFRYETTKKYYMTDTTISCSCVSFTSKFKDERREQWTMRNAKILLNGGFTKSTRKIIFFLIPHIIATLGINDEINDDETISAFIDIQGIKDEVDNSLYDPLQLDPDSCRNDITQTDDERSNDPSCWQVPQSTTDEGLFIIPDVQNDAKSFGSSQLENVELGGIRRSYGGDDPDANIQDSGPETTSLASNFKIPDKHWGSDPNILRMRDRLRDTGSGESIKRRVMEKRQCNASTDDADDPNHQTDTENRRPPIFLLPGLASTRLVAWRFKKCLLSEIKLKDHVWLNINLIMQMSTIDLQCFSECLKLGWNQSDTDDLSIGCKLRPDEGLDAISSLSPAGLGSQLLGGTNTVYAWLIQWLSDNLGYDVTSIIGLPYDWRLSPDKMESRDGFLTLTRHRIEAAVDSNGGEPGILVAHSMGNLVFRYFLNWLRSKLRDEAHNRLLKQSKKRKLKNHRRNSSAAAWTGIILSEFDDRLINSLVEQESQSTTEKDLNRQYAELWELAIEEGDEAWYEWIERHIWTYVGLSAPLLGAVNPVRTVISGESMGLPISDDAARWIELTFGSTHTVNPISTQEGFCDEWKIHDAWDEQPNRKKQKVHADSRLACMDDVVTEIEVTVDERKKTCNNSTDPWENFPALDHLLRKRADWDVDFPMISIVNEVCGEKEKPPCAGKNATDEFGPMDVVTGEIFIRFSEIWKEKEDPLLVKRDQLRESFWDTSVGSILNETWDRPLIKHIVMAYGVDIPTEVGYEYRKIEKTRKRERADEKSKKKRIEDSYDGMPTLTAVVWETENGRLVEERIENQQVLGDLLKIKKTKKTPLKDGTFHHSGDGSVPYISLSWAHTWLLHAARALLYSKQQSETLTYSCKTEQCDSSNPLDDIKISHRPKGETEWVEGPPPKRQSTLGEKKVESSSDTGTANPHGTKYKPEMIRYHNRGTSRTTGIEYTTTVIEAIGVEHKETPRNYDILAAVFSDVLKCMHDDFNIV